MTSPCPPIALGDIDAAIFDLDGVVTRTSRVHATAWKEAFDEFLRRECGPDAAPFDIEADYLEYVDGKPRYDGVASFLASRGIELPRGADDDGGDARTACGLGNRKNALFRAVLARDGVEVYPGAVVLLRRLRERGKRTALVSASKNCRQVMQAAGVEALFDSVVDGVVAAREGLAGKPAPDTFLRAARELGVTPARAVLFEDALAGVEAGRRGGFAMVVGVDRAGQAQALYAHGASCVVGHLSEMELSG